MIYSLLNIGGRIFSNFTLDSKEAAISDLVKGLEVRLEVNSALTEGNLLKAFNAFKIIGLGGNSIDILGVDLFQHNAVLSMGMDDIILKIMHSRYGVVTHYHNQVCGVEIDRNTG